MNYKLSNKCILGFSSFNTLACSSGNNTCRILRSALSESKIWGNIQAMNANQPPVGIVLSELSKYEDEF